MVRFVSLFLLAFTLATPVWALESAHLRYHTLTRHWSAFEELAPEARNRVRLTVRVEAPHASQPVAMWMEVAGHRYDLTVDSYGLVQVPRDADIIAADPVVESNQPRGSIETELALLLLVPDSQHFHYADLQAATDQTNALIRQAAGGLVAMFLPTITGVTFTCPTDSNDCAITVHRAAGDQVLRANQDGKILLPLNPALAAENPLIEASAPLSDIEPASD
jgi:hypothetical protein